MKTLFDVFWDHITSKYPDAIHEMTFGEGNEIREVQFYPSAAHRDRFDTYTCYIGENGSFVIESDF